MLATLALSALLAQAPGGIDATLALLQKQVRAKNWDAAAQALRALEAEVTPRAALEVTDIRVLAAEPRGLGIYSVPFDDVVRTEEIFLYAQVRNHALREAHGFYEVHLSTDLAIVDAEGREIGRDENLGESRFNARAPHRDTFVVIALRTKGLPKGPYTARMTLRDRIGGKSATADVVFRIP